VLPLLLRNRESSRPPWSLVDLAFILVTAIYLGAALIAEVTIWDDRPPMIILAVPVIVSAIWKLPSEVTIVAALSVLVAAADIMIDNPPDAIILSATLVSLLTLVGIDFGAILLSQERYAAAERRRRSAEAIRYVQDLRQPLTVITGYAQALRARPDLPACLQKPVDRIIVASIELNRLIGEALERELGPSP
jgi:signal transduction histidine kinase